MQVLALFKVKSEAFAYLSGFKEASLEVSTIFPEKLIFRDYYLDIAERGKWFRIEKYYTNDELLI